MDEATPGTTTAVSEAALESDFSAWGTAAGKACATQLSGQAGAEAILLKAGYVNTGGSKTDKYFSRPVTGGGKSFGGKDMGALYVVLPTTATKQGRMTCLATIRAFSAGVGNSFYASFQAAGRNSSIGPQIRISGDNEHGTSNMRMEYKRP